MTWDPLSYDKTREEDEMYVYTQKMGRADSTKIID